MSWYIATKLEFSDGGEDSYMLLGLNFPDEETCKRVADVMPAVSYNGDRPVKHAYLVWGPCSELGRRTATEQGREKK